MIPSFPIQIGGNVMSIEVEVVNAPLDYDILLGRSWMYRMIAMVSMIFLLIYFPLKGKIITID